MHIMRRQINNEYFRKLMDQIGPRAVLKLAVEAKCGHSTIEQMYRGTYSPKNGPGDSLRERICMAFKKLLKTTVSEDSLFPAVSAAEETAS